MSQKFVTRGRNNVKCEASAKNLCKFKLCVEESARQFEPE